MRGRTLSGRPRPGPVGSARAATGGPRGVFGEGRGREAVGPGLAGEPNPAVRAAAEALERAERARSVVLVEGISDRIALETLAVALGRDLAAEGVVVVPMHGIHAVSRFLARLGPAGAGLRVGGLCDVAEAGHVARVLWRTLSRRIETRDEIEQAGFFVCDRDLEDELIRAVGRDAVEAIVEEEGDLGALRTLQAQAAWRDAPFGDQVRRFLGAGAGRKGRYAARLVCALEPDREPRPLRAVLDRA